MESDFSDTVQYIPDSKVHGTHLGPTWVLSAPDGPHVGPMNLAIWDPNDYASGLLFAVLCCDQVIGDFMNIYSGLL